MPPPAGGSSATYPRKRLAHVGSTLRFWSGSRRRSWRRSPPRRPLRPALPLRGRRRRAGPATRSLAACNASRSRHRRCRMRRARRSTPPTRDRGADRSAHDEGTAEEARGAAEARVREIGARVAVSPAKYPDSSRMAKLGPINPRGNGGSRRARYGFLEDIQVLTWRRPTTSRSTRSQSLEYDVLERLQRDGVYRAISPLGVDPAGERIRVSERPKRYAGRLLDVPDRHLVEVEVADFEAFRK